MNDSQNLRSPQPQKRHRRRVMVNPSFQWKYAITLGLTVFFVSCILNCSLFAALHDQARHRFMSPRGDIGGLAFTLVGYAVGLSTIAAAAVGFWIIVGTRRICGPLILLDRHFRDMATGKFPSLRPLRKKDEFKDLFRTFGFAIERLRSDKRAELEMVIEAQQKANAGAHGDDDECRQALADVTQQLREMRRMLEQSLCEPLPAARSGPANNGQLPSGPNPAVLSESGSAAPAHPKRHPVGVA